MKKITYIIKVTKVITVLFKALKWRLTKNYGKFLLRPLQCSKYCCYLLEFVGTITEDKDFSVVGQTVLMTELPLLRTNKTCSPILNPQSCIADCDKNIVKDFLCELILGSSENNNKQLGSDWYVSSQIQQQYL